MVSRKFRLYEARFLREKRTWLYQVFGQKSKTFKKGSPPSIFWAFRTELTLRSRSVNLIHLEFALFLRMTLFLGIFSTNFGWKETAGCPVFHPAQNLTFLTSSESLVIECSGGKWPLLIPLAGTVPFLCAKKCCLFLRISLKINKRFLIGHIWPVNDLNVRQCGWFILHIALFTLETSKNLAAKLRNLKKTMNRFNYRVWDTDRYLLVCNQFFRTNFWLAANMVVLEVSVASLPGFKCLTRSLISTDKSKRVAKFHFDSVFECFSY